jgi:NTE family protein
MAFDAMQSTIARQKLAAYPPDVVIEIPRNACGTLEFDRAAEMIELGRRKARDCITSARKQGAA